MPRWSDLSKIPPFDKKAELWRVIVETPKGSSNKYSYNPEFGCFELKRVLPEGMTFPFDFGFIPSTLADDGDPLDILVLTDFAAARGTMVNVRLIGGIEARQKKKGDDWQRNDRLIAVAEHSHTLSDIAAFADLRGDLVDQIEAFFVQYNKLDGKKFEPIGNCKAKQAEKLVEKSRRKFRKQQ